MKSIRAAILVVCLATFGSLITRAQGSNCNADLNPDACWGV